MANSAGRSRLRWRAVRTTLASTCWVSAPLRVRLPPQTLRVTTAGRMACSARQLVASTDGSHRKVNMAENSVARWAAKRSGVVQRRRVVDQPAEPGQQAAAGGGQTVLAQTAGVAPVAQREAGLQGVLHLAGPPAVGMILLQMLTTSPQVLQTGLVLAVGVAAVHHPPVAHEHAVEVGPEDRLRVVESAARADGVDGRRRGDGRPQPVADGADAPTGLIGRDHGSVADLLAQLLVGRPRVACRTMQQIREPPPA